MDTDAPGSPPESFFRNAVGDDFDNDITATSESHHQTHDQAPAPPEIAEDEATEVDESETCEATEESAVTIEQPSSPHGMFIFVIGENRFESSFELGVLNERPDALEAVCPDQPFKTSTFLIPAMRAVTAQLETPMKIQLAVRLCAVSLRLAAKLMFVDTNVLDGSDSGDQEEEWMQRVLEQICQAVPHLPWHGNRTHCGRVRSLMASLEESVRIMEVSLTDLAQELRDDFAASQAACVVLRAINHFGQDQADVLGSWAPTILSGLRYDRNHGLSLNRDRSTSREALLRQFQAGSLRKRRTSPDDGLCQVRHNSPVVTISDDSDHDEERPLSPRIASKNSMMQHPLPPTQAVDPKSNDEPGIRADIGACASSNHGVNPVSRTSGPLTTRKSDREQARKLVDYNTNRHPQDGDIPTERKTKVGKRPPTGMASASSPAKRNKTAKLSD